MTNIQIFIFETTPESIETNFSNAEFRRVYHRVSQLVLLRLHKVLLINNMNFSHQAVIPFIN